MEEKSSSEMQNKKVGFVTEEEKELNKKVGLLTEVDAKSIVMGSSIRLVYPWEEKDFEIKSLEPLEIFTFMKRYSATEFTMTNLFQNFLSKDLASLNRGKSLFFWCQEAFSLSKLMLNDSDNQLSRLWKELDSGSGIFLQSSRIATRKRFCCLGQGPHSQDFKIQEFALDRLDALPSFRDERDQLFFEKVHNMVFYEMALSSTPLNISIPRLEVNILLEILIRTSVVTMVRCSGVDGFWRLLITRNMEWLLQNHNQMFRFLFITKPLGLHTNFLATVHVGCYKPHLNTFHVDDTPVWSPRIGTNCLDGQIIGSLNGMLCVARASTSSFADPIVIFNPTTKEYYELPRIRTRYSKSTWCTSGFGYDPGLKVYYVIRIIYSGRGDQRKVKVYVLGSGTEWLDSCFLPCEFGKFTSNGLHVNQKLHFLDTNGVLAAYELRTNCFAQVAGPTVDIGEVEHRQSSVLAKHDNHLAVIILDYAEKRVSVLLQKNSIWELLTIFKMSLGRVVYSPLTLLSDRMLLLADDKYIVSRVFADDDEKVLVEFSDTFSAEFVEHDFGCSFLPGFY